MKGSKSQGIWDIDTNKQKDGWVCNLYHNNTLVISTKFHEHKKDARKEIVQKMEALSSKDAPPRDKNGFDVVWNSDHDFTDKSVAVGSQQFSDNWHSNEFWEGGAYTGSGYTGTSTQLGGFTGTTYKHCDHDPLELPKNSPFSIKDVQIIGATKACIKPLQEGEKRLIVNCSGNTIKLTPKPKTVPLLSIPKSLSFLCKPDYALVEEEPDFGDELLIDWRDQSAAPLTVDFWYDLLRLIESDAFPYRKVVFCCMGGHGRTGTALASLALVAHVFDGKPVTFEKEPNRKPTKAETAEIYVQSLYCKEAVESKAQVRYLEYVEANLR